ncbi:MAG: valine--tRNA ligase [bacterium]|nr:valine--tRNA ligase [bacterium]
MKPTYEPHDIEARWYPIWEESGSFRPELNPDGDPFTISIPPPNVTGVLHMGHALDGSIQDAIIRRKRMQGYQALWLPGMDHAGIATQNVVERELAKEGMTRHDLGREKFIEQVWAWKATSGGTITKQMRAMGFSCDWSRERFTLDEGLSAAVREVFVTLYEEGLIYRGNRIINWCPRCHTAISDIEVEYQDETGTLTHIRYPFSDGDGDGYVEVATTRPETMLGDTAVAVHPDDPRYAGAIGRTVRLPLMDRDIPIVADDAVEMEFGTGAVKVTPAHDPLDFEIGLRHDLEPIRVIDTEANITPAGGRFAGMDRFDARAAVVEALGELGVLGEIEDHHHSVGHCSRCKTVIEPMLSLQWFVKVQPLVTPAIAAVKDGHSRFVPKRWENSYFPWMENLRDWTISRQLWWGHRIPAWYCNDCDKVIVTREDPVDCPDCHGTVYEDEDVLDTWFSSALWPFSTLGWPEQTEDLATFYPTSVLVTGYDIIYFWVARMLKMGIHFTGKAPFADIAIHGMVRAEDGRKMSKSLGNSVDPLELVDEYGADPLRLSLLQAAAQGEDVPFSEEWVDAARRFGNKLWNALRFAVEHVGISDVPASEGYPADPPPPEQWILSRLHTVTAEYDALLDEYKFSDAVALIYNFAWSEVFDWYLEMAKTPLKDESRSEVTKQTLGVVLRDLLKLLHPLMPSVTEELWSELVGDGLLIAAAWPQPPAHEVPAGVGDLQELIIGLRRFRAEHNLGARKLALEVDHSGGTSAEWWMEQLSALGRVDATVTRASIDTKAQIGRAHISAGDIHAYIPLEGVIDPEAECPRLRKAIAEAEGMLKATEGKLANSNFVERAPDEVVAKERAKAAEFTATLERLQGQLTELGC